MEDELLLCWGSSWLSANKSHLSKQCLKEIASEFTGIEEDALYFTSDGKKLEENCFVCEKLQIKDGALIIRCNSRLPGGKGGFGSMLRALGAQIEKTTNREACRDLSGRRMRDVNNEKKIADWLEKEKRDKEEKAKKKKEKLERILNPPKHMLSDSTYANEIRENADKVDDALRQGLQNATSSQKFSVTSSLGKRQKHGERMGKAKKPKMWLELEEEDLSSGSDSDIDDDKIENLASPVENAIPNPVKSEQTAFEDKQSTESQSTACSIKEEDASTKNPDVKSVIKEENQICSGKEVQNSNQRDAEDPAIDLCAVTTAEELEAYGLEKLKNELSKRGLKCGGTLQQRAQRLFLLKETPIDQLDPSLFAKQNKKNKTG